MGVPAGGSSDKRRRVRPRHRGVKFPGRRGPLKVREGVTGGTKLFEITPPVTQVTFSLGDLDHFRLRTRVGPTFRKDSRVLDVLVYAPFHRISCK